MFYIKNNRYSLSYILTKHVNAFFKANFQQVLQSSCQRFHMTISQNQIHFVAVKVLLATSRQKYLDKNGHI